VTGRVPRACRAVRYPWAGGERAGEQRPCSTARHEAAAAKPVATSRDQLDATATRASGASDGAREATREVALATVPQPCAPIHRGRGAARHLRTQGEACGRDPVHGPCDGAVIPGPHFSSAQMARAADGHVVPDAEVAAWWWRRPRGRWRSVPGTLVPVNGLIDRGCVPRCARLSIACRPGRLPGLWLAVQPHRADRELRDANTGDADDR
jgi:hypothetical protein